MSDLTPLIEEAAKKSGLLWIALPDLPHPRAAWHIWHEGSAYLVTGGEGEQPLPGLPEAEQVTVIVRSKDKGGRLVSWTAAVSEVEAGGELWEAVVPRLAKDRLNAASHEGQAERWARESYVIRLTPTGEVSEAPGRQRNDYAAVRPVPTPASTAGKGPFMVGGKRRRADR
ncbi:hypothetical protein [Actinomadura sp. HBU206391]|uniref:hypothetical protein n=1 Tax=Actinomadura sp. HBU206391 TaxID=2731692 RepID=UPI00164F41B3|nr:hypothetical protein [Actinomadura sp. HBU206391]MBC6461746.1 hypothetical protein [Actinomadura sp. HBU206391]